jgi:3D (Asp-Asp-Asp) domain-containing protein
MSRGPAGPLLTLLLLAAVFLASCAKPAAFLTPQSNILAPGPGNIFAPAPSNVVAPAPSNWRGSEDFSRKHWKRFARPSSEEISATHELYGTYYCTPTFGYQGEGIPVRDSQGEVLGPVLSREAFCHAANEGAFRAPPSHQAKPVAFTFKESRPDTPSQTSCKDVFAKKLEQHSEGKTTDPWPDLVERFERTRFTRTSAPYGNATANWWLVPWRTLATDTSVIPSGSVVYIPKADGRQVALPSGQVVTHDGYFLAADTGKGIIGNHVDLFSGPACKSTFVPGIGGEKNRFTAVVVNRSEIAAHLKGLHQMP